MSLQKPIAAGAGLIVLLAVAVTQTLAGTSFRLEIGPAIAAGIANSKDLKNNDFKKVVLVVRPRVCDNPASVQITGIAEGLWNGVRQSVALSLVPVDEREGVYAVHRQWPDRGQWVLHLKGSCASPRASASTLVPMNQYLFIREKTEVLREPATKKQLEDALAALVRSQS